MLNRIGALVSALAPEKVSMSWNRSKPSPWSFPTPAQPPPQDPLQMSALESDNSNNAEQPHVDANTNPQNMIGRHTHSLPETH